MCLKKSVTSQTPLSLINLKQLVLNYQLDKTEAFEVYIYLKPDFFIIFIYTSKATVCIFST